MLSMDEGQNQFLQAPGLINLFNKHVKPADDQWGIMEDDASSSSLEDSNISNRSSSSSELVDDASSSTSCSSSSNSNGRPLYELSELMAQLPLKRGLSKYFQGKSQSFTSLSRARSIEDLAKKETPYRKKMKMKACKSYGGGLDAHRTYTLPKPYISKKDSKAFSGRRGSFLGGNRFPPITVQKKF